MTNTQLAAAVASADQSSSDQSSCHFFGKAHLPTQNHGWGCVIAKVEPSKSSWLRPKSAENAWTLYVWVRKWIWTMENVTSFYQLKSADVSWFQLIKWGHIFHCPNSFSNPYIQSSCVFSWFWPQSAAFWGFNFGNHATSPMILGGELRLAKKVSAALVWSKLVSWFNSCSQITAKS